MYIGHRTFKVLTSEATSEETDIKNSGGEPGKRGNVFVEPQEGDWRG